MEKSKWSEKTFKELEKCVDGIVYKRKFLKSLIKVNGVENIKIGIRKERGKGIDKWLICLTADDFVMRVDYPMVIGEITYTVGGKGFATHFKYEKDFNNLLRLTYYDMLKDYKIYGRIVNESILTKESKREIYFLTHRIDLEVRNKIENKIIPFIEKSLNIEIDKVGLKHYSQYRGKLNSLLIQNKDLKGISYKNLKNNLKIFFCDNRELMNFLNYKSSDDTLLNMMKNQKRNEEFENLEDVLNTNHYNEIIMNLRLEYKYVPKADSDDFFDRLIENIRVDKQKTDGDEQ